MEPETPDTPQELPFGARFLARYAEISGARGPFRYATVQALKQADREEFLAHLRQVDPFLSYAAILRIRREAPERLAEELHQQQQLAQVALLAALL
ncbi:MAG: hypothetical protein AAF682_30755 [Planctomycetota bacterium]